MMAEKEKKGTETQFYNQMKTAIGKCNFFFSGQWPSK